MSEINEFTNNNTEGKNENPYTRSYQADGNYRDVHPDYSGQYRYDFGQSASQTAAYTNVSTAEPKKKQKKERKKTLAGRIAAAVLTGVVFGGSAAGAMYGVNKLTGVYDNASYSNVKEKSEKIAEKKADTAKSEKIEDKSNGSAIEHTYKNDDSDMISAGTGTVVTDVSKVVDRVMPAIVTITNNGSYQYFYYTMPTESEGSGIIIGSNDEELLIVTNYHVVEDNEELSVTFVNDQTYTALVKGSDSSRDLAVIAVKLEDMDDETLDAIDIAEMGDSDALKVGEPAIAIGNALGIGQSVTTGVISALNRQMEMENIKGTFIQTDAAINEGNSGGALLNINGEVIGINSNKIGGSKVEGMGYAIPISAARPIIEELMTKTTRTLVPEAKRGYLGIRGATVTAEEATYYGYPEGVYVANINDGSPAEQGGLMKGDYIVAFDGEKISSMEQLQKLLMYYERGEEVEVDVTRVVGNSYKDLTVKITLGDRNVIDGMN
ncbi:MAG: trypsin-like peptidase domain-containing protein [Lachnospiraceae bacterium]|nr:trypsin-like peptidase domain-containing protein [Lachnospiraceae bacterium]